MPAHNMYSGAQQSALNRLLRVAHDGLFGSGNRYEVSPSSSLLTSVWNTHAPLCSTALRKNRTVEDHSIRGTVL